MTYLTLIRPCSKITLCTHDTLFQGESRKYFYNFLICVTNRIYIFDETCKKFKKIFFYTVCNFSVHLH